MCASLKHVRGIDIKIIETFFVLQIISIQVLHVVPVHK